MTNIKKNDFSLPIDFSLGKYIIKKCVTISENFISYLALDSQINANVYIDEFYPNSLVNRNPDGSITATDQQKFQSLQNIFSTDTYNIMSLVHPCICPVLDFFSYNGTYYKVSQYIEGETLGNLLNKLPQGSLIQKNQVLSYLLPILNALQAGHKKNIFHLNLNPETILISRNEVPVLVNFGDSLSPQISNYKAPELLQENKDNVGTWTDIYSLGCVLFRCLIGKEPVDVEQRRNALGMGENDPLSDDLAALDSKDCPQLAKAIKESLLLNVKTRLQNPSVFITSVRVPEAAPAAPTAPSSPGPQTGPSQAVAISKTPQPSSPAASVQTRTAPPPNTRDGGALKNWFIPPDPGRPEGISDEELRELRAVAVRETKRTKKKDYSLADSFAEIDAGGTGKFSTPALVLSSAWLAYGFMAKRALIVLGAELLLSLITVLIVPHYADIANYIYWILVGIPCGLYGRRWLWERVGQRINAFWERTGHNFEQTRLLLSQEVSKKVGKVVLLTLCALPIIVIFYYIQINSPKCANRTYYPTIISTYKKQLSIATNLSISDIDKNLSFDLIDVRPRTQKFGRCLCDGTIMMTTLANKDVNTSIIEFQITTGIGGALSPSFLVEIYE